MNTVHQIVKCETCGNIVEVLDGGKQMTEACHKPQTLVEKTEDVGTEKHTPVIEVSDHEIKVTIGSVPHPMEDAHFIQWIELVAGDKVYRQMLHPGSPAVAVFPKVIGPFIVREYCNLHGLWKKENK